MEIQDSCFPGDSTGRAAGITSLPSDIILSHILTKLDGQSLASTSCSSPQLHTLCSEQSLWKDICNSTFPSTTNPLVHNTITNFPSGHRSFFSDTFPTLHHHNQQPKSKNMKKYAEDITQELISAVDVRFGDDLDYSKVVVTESRTGWFSSSPFRIELVGSKDFFPISVKFEGEESQLMKSLMEEMKLSWIIVDPARKRAVNLSSYTPVDVRRNRFTGYIEVRFATVMATAAGVEGGAVCYVVTVTCGGKEGRGVHVMEICMQVENMEGKVMNGKDSLVILHEAMEGGRRAKSEMDEKRKRYQNFIEMRRMWRENKQKREKRIDMVCMACGVAIFIALLSLVFFS